jgi:hypothetical protein
MSLAGILAACDAQSPVATTGPVPVSRKASSSPLGSISVAPNVGGHGLYLATVVPANTLARVRVTGSIDWSPNHPAYWNEQECDKPDREFPCRGLYSEAGSYGVVHPASLTHGAGLRMVLGASPDPASPPHPGSLFNTSGMSWEWAAGKEARPYWEGFIATADERAGIWYSPPGGPGNSEYVVTGEYTITVERLDLGWEMHRTPGQVEYSVSAPAGLETRGIYWMFSPDTSSTLRWGKYTEVAGCSGSTRCKHNSLSGRMFAEVRVTSEAARATGGVHGYASPLIRFDPLVEEEEKPKLALTCTGNLGANRVTRGQQITCTASTDAATAPGELKITGWSFEGKARTDGDVTSTRWAGVMVQSGTVMVRGTIGTTPEQAERVLVSVEARKDWAGKIVYPAALPNAVVDPERFPNPPVRDSSGYDVYIPGGLGVYEFDLSWRGHLALVATGPNKDWWYLKTPPQWATPLVYLSPYLEPGNPFYEAQTGKRAGDKNPPRGYTGWCTKADMNLLRQEVLDHEGAINGPRLSHHEFNLAYTRQRDPGPQLEAVAFYLADQTASLQDTAETHIGRAYEDQLLASNNAAVHAPSNTYTVPCKVHYP